MRGVKSTRPRHVENAGQIQELANLFQDLNKRFWRGRLRAYRVIYSKLPGNTRGVCNSKRRTIYIREGLQGDQLRRVLLHEMCHIGCRYHGRKFLAHLAHLAEQGEAWANLEIESYRTAPTWNQQMHDL